MMCLPSHALSVLQNAEGRLATFLIGCQSGRHAEGIHYGDVNKFNILVTPENEVVLIDFGNATLLAISGWTGKQVDTPRFSS